MAFRPLTVPASSVICFGQNCYRIVTRPSPAMGLIFLPASLYILRCTSRCAAHRRFENSRQNGIAAAHAARFAFQCF